MNKTLNLTESSKKWHVDVILISYSYYMDINTMILRHYQHITETKIKILTFAGQRVFFSLYVDSVE